MDRREPYFDQLVTSQNVVQWFDDAERADHNMMSDLGFVGIMTGLVASQNGAGDYTVNVSAGTAYDQTGERIRVPSTQNVDLSVDYLNASTNVSASGHSKVISLFAQFKRNPQTPETDGNGNTVYYDDLESFTWVVVQGSEAATGTQTPPAKISNGLLVCNVTIAYSTSPQQIVTADISTTTRDDLVVASGTPLAIRRGKYSDAIGDIVGQLNNIASGSQGITWGPGPSWAGGTSPANPATTLSAEVTKILTDLSAIATGASGADRIGVAALVGASSTIGAGTLFNALTFLKAATSIDVGALGNWLDGATNPATNAQAAIGQVISDLSSTSTSGRGTGAAKIGIDAGGNFTSTSVRGQLQELTGTSAANDGAKRIGAQASGGFSTSTVRGQLDELQTNKGGLTSSNHWIGANTFDNIATTAGNSYKLSSRSITRAQTGWMNVSSGSNPTGSSVSLNVGANFAQKLMVPHGAQITSVVVHVAPGAHASLPGNLPTLTLWREDLTTGTGTSIGTVTDNGSLWTTNNAAGYSTAHDLPITGLNETVDRTKYVYFVSFVSESGANSTSITAYAARVTYATATIDDGY